MWIQGRVLPMFKIIYPEARVVDGAQIIRWYQDAVANGEVEEVGITNAHQAARVLHGAGLITCPTHSELRPAYACRTEVSHIPPCGGCGKTRWCKQGKVGPCKDT